MPPPSPGGGRPNLENDVFPPTRSLSSFDSDASFRAAYGQEPLDDFGDYEIDDLLSPREGGEIDGMYGEFDPTSSRAAWDRLGDLMGNYDDISDSESVGSLNFLGFRDTDTDSYSSDGSVSDLDIEDDLSKEQIRQDWAAIRCVSVVLLSLFHV